MFYPGFEPKIMSDDQLLDRTIELTNKIMWASRYTSCDAVEPLQRMLEMIETERRERQFMENWELAAPKLNEIIESDPSLHKQPDLKEKKSFVPAGNTAQRQRNKVRRSEIPMVTPHPVLPSSALPGGTEKK